MGPLNPDFHGLSKESKYLASERSPVELGHILDEQVPIVLVRGAFHAASIGSDSARPGIRRCIM